MPTGTWMLFVLVASQISSRNLKSSNTSGWVCFPLEKEAGGNRGADAGFILCDTSAATSLSGKQEFGGCVVMQAGEGIAVVG